MAIDAYDEGASFSYPTTFEVRASIEHDIVLAKHIIYEDSLVALRFYPHGQLKVKDVSVRGGPLSGAWLLNETYHPNGQLREKWHPYSDTLELRTTFYENGQREREYWSFGGRAFNDWTEWYEDGQIKLEAQYERGPLTEAMKDYRNSVRIGNWRYYRSNGELEKVEVYENGKLMETRTQ